MALHDSQPTPVIILRTGVASPQDVLPAGGDAVASGCRDSGVVMGPIVPRGSRINRFAVVEQAAARATTLPEDRTPRASPAPRRWPVAPADVPRDHANR